MGNKEEASVKEIIKTLADIINNIMINEDNYKETNEDE